MQISQIFTDKAEYSRYLPELATISATIIVSDPIEGAAIQVALSRLDGYGIVAEKSLTLKDGMTSYQVKFDLTRDTYDLKGIYRARQGDYVIQAYGADNEILAESPMFAVSIVSVREIKNSWAAGVTFMNYEILLPKQQPQRITGAVVTEVPIVHYKGVFVLKYTASTKSLSWDGGMDVAVNGLHPQTLLLLNARQQDYILVSVDPSKLPDADVVEPLVIDNSTLTDRDIIKQVRLATDWVEQRIITKVEPQIVDTEQEEFSDQLAIPQTYYRPSHQMKWMSFNLPYPNILDVENITGWFNTSKSAHVPRGWYVWHERTGIVELVPSSASQVTWQFYNGIFVMSYLLNFPSIPGFWHYRLTAGLRDLTDERGVVREAIAKKACIDLLTSAGTAYRAGYSSESVSRDGISSSQTYTSSATYNIYSAHTEAYEKWLKAEMPRIKKRFSGLQFTSI